MSSRKHISVNLRDLQRVMADAEPEKPVISSSITEKAKFGAAKTFEYKISSSRWGNEIDDDDFDNLYTDKKVEAEPDFSTLRKQAPNTTKKTTTVDTWRTVNSSTSDKTSSDDVWRSSYNKDKAELRSRNTKDPFNRDGKSNEEKKLYVPPRARREEVVNDRFSCFSDSRKEDDNKPHDEVRSKEPPRSEHRPRDDWGHIEEVKKEPKTSDRYRDSGSQDRRGDEEFRESYRDNVNNDRGAVTGGGKGLFVPSYKRAQKVDNVEDIFKRAAGIQDVDFEKSKKDVSVVSEQYNQTLLSKRNEIIKYNRQFKCSEECVESVVEVVESLLNGEDIQEFSDIIDQDDINSLVPTIISCLVIAKHCESKKTLDDVYRLFSLTHNWLKFLLDHNDRSYRIKLLTEIAKFINHWNYPVLSESLYLIEAVFDSLYRLNLIVQEDFISWFEHDIDEIPNRLTVIIQLMSWKKWLSGELACDDAGEEEEEEEEEDEDVDIEALVPKPIRLTKGVKYQ